MEQPQEKKIFVIDGNNFNDLDSFYIESEKVFTKDFRSGRNMNAFIDLLKGGFGKFEYEESIKLVWNNSDKSKKDFGQDLFGDIVEYISENSHTELILK